MLNQVVIVGRLTKDPEMKELEGGKKVSNVTLAVPRSFKNEEGEYDTDFVDCSLWAGIAESTSEYCRKGDLIGVKGRVSSKDGIMNIAAEKVTFLSNKKNVDNSRNIEPEERKEI